MFHHHPGHRLTHQEHRLEVDRDHAIEVFFLEVEKFGGVRDAGVVDQYVDAPEMLDGHRSHSGDGLTIADVDGDTERVCPAGLGLGDDLGNRRRCARGDNDLSTFHCVLAGDRPADAAARAGDDDDFVLQ